MEDSNLHFSPAELQLFSNSEIILTKNRIIAKTISLLEKVQTEISQEKLSGEIFQTTPKISKGENYLGLPYAILDYPRKTDGQNICFIRSMVWWGHFYSSTLHITGKYKQMFVENLFNKKEELISKNYFIGINENQWEHHFHRNNYIPISEFNTEDFKKIIYQKDTLKVATYWPLSQWPESAPHLIESWSLLKSLIT